MLAAPLLAGNDLRNMSAATKAILTNSEVIAIDQDPLGAEPTRLSNDGNADFGSPPARLHQLTGRTAPVRGNRHVRLV